MSLDGFDGHIRCATTYVTRAIIVESDWKNNEEFFAKNEVQNIVLTLVLT